MSGVREDRDFERKAPDISHRFDQPKRKAALAGRPVIPSISCPLAASGLCSQIGRLCWHMFTRSTQSRYHRRTMNKNMASSCRRSNKKPQEGDFNEGTQPTRNGVNHS